MLSRTYNIAICLKLEKTNRLGLGLGLGLGLRLTKRTLHFYNKCGEKRRNYCPIVMIAYTSIVVYILPFPDQFLILMHRITIYVRS